MAAGSWMRACARKYRKTNTRFSWRTFMRKRCGAGKKSSGRRKSSRVKRRTYSRKFIGPLTASQAARVERAARAASRRVEAEVRRRAYRSMRKKMGKTKKAKKGDSVVVVPSGSVTDAYLKRMYSGYSRRRRRSRR